MKKWLSVLLMTSLLFGAAYFAVATESGRKVLSKTENLGAMLSEIDALLAKDQTNADLLRKQAEVAAELASNGIAVPITATTDDAGKQRALAEERARLEANGEYYSMLLERMNQGSILSPVEKVELLQSGMLKGEEDPAYQAIMQDVDQLDAAYVSALIQRMEAGQQLSASEKQTLDESGALNSQIGSRPGSENLDDVGGPSLTAYRWVDNQNGDTATYAWEELDTTAGAISLTALNSSDDANASISWGWNFPFFGTNYTSGFVTTNGYLAFGTGSSDFSNDCRRSAGTPTGPTIMPYWDDLNLATGGPGVPDEGRLVWQNFTDHVTITWDSVGICCTDATDLIDFQCQIWTDGKIKYQYRYIRKNSGTDIDGSSPTIGIQQSNNAGGLDSLIYYCNATIMDSAYTNHLGGRAIWFYPSTFANDDYTAAAILQPTATRVLVGSSVNVVGRFRNAGNTNQSSPVGYSFGASSGTDVTDALALNGVDTVDFAGTATAPAVPGVYPLKVYTALAADQDLMNDTARVNINVVNCFDEIHTGAFGDTFTTCGAINDWANTCLGTADGSEDYIIQWNVTQPGAYNILAIGTTTTTRGLLVSSACPPDSFNCVAQLNQSQDTLLINCLTLNVGTYYIMVDRLSGCDQVRLYTAPCQDHDFAIESVLQPSPLRVSPGASFNVAGRFRNIGTNTEAADVSYRFNGGAVVSGITAVIAPGATSDVDFPGTETAPGTVGDYELLMYSNLTTDQNRFNDTLRVTVLVRDCPDEDQTDAFVDAGTTCGASNEWANTCLGSADASEDYIYRWTTTTNGSWNLLVTATTSATRGLLVATSCPPDSFNCVAFINTTNDSAALSCVPLAAGTYYIMVDRSTGCDAYTLAVSPCTTIGRCCYNGGVDCADNGAYDCQQLGGQWTSTTTCAASPCPLALEGGETCATAVGITVPATVRGTTVGGVDDDPGTQCALGSTDPYEGSNTAPDDWYSITGTGNQITVSLCAAYTTFDTQILVVCSDNCTNFTCVAGNDDATCTFSGVRSTATFCSELGRNYYVVVDGWSVGNGLFELSIVEGAACVDFVDCAPEGRCCYLDNGVATCVDNLAAECLTLNGQWVDAASCANDPCPVGRCCYVDNGLAACADLTDLECQAVGGDWNGTTTCAATPCPVGRCCYNDGGSTLCADNTEIECTLLNGLWDDLLSCATDPCPQVLQGTDSCYNAPLITLLDQPYLGSTVGATQDTIVYTTGEPCSSAYRSFGAHPHPGIWYSFIGTGNGMTVHTCNALTGYDTEIYVFCNTCDSLACVETDDDSCTTPALSSSTSFCTVLGATYYTLISAYSTASGDVAVTLTDDGIPCTPLIACPAPTCDAPVDLCAYVVTSANVPQSIQLHFTAPQDADYKVWYSTNPNNDGNPDDGTDPNFALETTLTGVLDGQLVVYNSPAAFVNYRYYVVTADCGN